MPSFLLLIEPIWNRNKSNLLLKGLLGSLLIEPIWNRNVLADVNAVSVEKLLIEPIWNRNSSVNESLFGLVNF